MKTKRITIVIVSVVLVFVFVLSVGAFAFVKIGKKIVNAPVHTPMLINSGQKIIFNDTRKQNILHSFDIESGKLTTFNAGNCKYFETKENKYKIDGTVLTDENKITKEKRTVYNVNTNKLYKYDSNQPYNSFSLDFLGEYQSHLYFYFKDKTKKDGFIYRYDPVSNVLSEFKTQGRFNGVYGNSIFVKLHNDLLKIDTETNEETHILTLTENENTVGFNSNGITVQNYDFETQQFQLKLYDFDGTLKCESEIINDISPPGSYDNTNCIYVTTSNADGKPRLIRFSNDLANCSEVCSSLLPNKRDYPDLYERNSLPKTLGYIYNGSKLYYLVVPSTHQNDAFAFCSIDENGKIEVLKYKTKHFMYKIFKPNVIYK